MEDDKNQPSALHLESAAPLVALVDELAAASQMFNFVFVTWAPNSLHWDAPSTLSIQWDGTWSFFATHLANFRRTGGFFDTGDTHNFGITLSFYDVIVDQQPTHAPLYTMQIGVATIGYKQSQDNVVLNGQDTRIGELAAQIKSANCIRTM